MKQSVNLGRKKEKFNKRIIGIHTVSLLLQIEIC